MAAKTVLFYRNFRRLSGGHLKMWHYFCHLHAAGAYKPEVFFAEGSVFSDENPWMAAPDCIVSRWDPEAADVLFIGGTDWTALDPFPGIEDRVPVINLIQGMRHADADEVRYRFLDRQAYRICVGPEVADAIAGSGRCRGPIFTIPSGVDRGVLPPARPEEAKDVDVVIAGLKHRAMARELRERLRAFGATVDCMDVQLPRSQYLDRINRGRVAVTLPRIAEGFYLPALEAMALGCIVVCPDCVGNRSFCKDGWSCLMPAYDADAIFERVAHALRLDADERRRIVDHGREMAEGHSLDAEAASFRSVLNELGI